MQDMLPRSQEFDCPMNRQMALLTRHFVVNREHTLERFATNNFRWHFARSFLTFK